MVLSRRIHRGSCLLATTMTQCIHYLWCYERQGCRSSQLWGLFSLGSPSWQLHGQGLDDAGTGSFARAVAEFPGWEAGLAVETSLLATIPHSLCHHSNGVRVLIHHLLFIQLCDSQERQFIQFILYPYFMERKEVAAINLVADFPFSNHTEVRGPQHVAHSCVSSIRNTRQEETPSSWESSPQTPK